MAFLKTKKQIPSDMFQISSDINTIYEEAKKREIEVCPFDIFAYVSTIHFVALYDEDFEYDISGIIEYVNGRYKITLNKYHSETRKRFTLAHELAHLILHQDYLKEHKIEDRILFRKNGEHNEIEREANEFAAKLLMPEDSFSKAISSGKNTIEKLASYFNVSLAAVKYRAFRLGYIKEY